MRTPCRLLLCLLALWSFTGAAQTPSDTIPVGGNAWRMTAAGPGAVGDSAGGFISNKGIEGWTDRSVNFEIWFRTATPGSIRLLICAGNPGGRSGIGVAVGKIRRLGRIDIEGDAPQYLPAGVYSLPDTGYHCIHIYGLQRTGARFADIPAVVVQGTALRGRTAFVPNDEGNFFHWGRRGPSVHLNYLLPETFDASWFYNEVTVPPGNDIRGSYFMACGFAGGYFGMQVNGPGERHILFSVWSPYQTDNPATIPDSLRVILLKKGPGVHGGEFGNEGSGGQSYLNYPWKSGRTYRFLLHAAPGPHGHTVFTAWWFAPEEGLWRLIARFSRPRTTARLTGLYSFLENFEPEAGNRERHVLFNHAWASDSAGHWFSLRRAKFTVDNTGRRGYRMDFAGGIMDGSFYLQNDGFFNRYTPGGIWLDQPAGGDSTGPGIALPLP